MTIWERIAGPQGKAVLVLILVFLAGGGSGYFLGRWEAARWAPWERRPPSSYRARTLGGGRYWMERLDRDLNLRPEQRERIGEALRRHYERLMRLRQEMHPRVEGILHEVRNEIDTFLDPDQRERFDRMVAKFEERRRHWREQMRRRMEHMGGPMMRGRGMMGGPGPGMRRGPGPEGR